MLVLKNNKNSTAACISEEQGNVKIPVVSERYMYKYVDTLPSSSGGDH